MARSFSRHPATMSRISERVAVDLSGHMGREIVIRIVDAEIGGWGQASTLID